MAESNGTGTITWTLTVDGAQVFTTSGTGTTASFNWNANSVSFGSHTLGLTVRDGSGQTATATRTVKVVAPLTASITSPSEGATVTGVVTVNMVETGDYNSPITFILTVDGAQVFMTRGFPNSASFDWNTAGYTGGPHTLGLLVRDGVGRTATATRHVTIPGGPGDLTASIDSPAEGATVSGTVTVAMSEQNGTGTISWTVRLDGGATPIFSTSNAGPTASFSWDTSGVAPGAHTLTLTVQDGGGHTATATRNVTVQLPSTIKVFITQPGADGATVSGTTWFTIWIENAAAGSKTYTMSVDGTAVGTTNTTSNGPVSMPWTTTGTPNGSHSVTISVRDSAGGTGQAVRVVTVAN